MAGAISAWSITVYLAEGLRRGDLLNSTTEALISPTEGLTGFAEKPKRAERLKGGPNGQVIFRTKMDVRSVHPLYVTIWKLK